MMENDVVIKIISFVKQFPALYDTSHEDYNRYHKKIQIWNQIAEAVHFSDGKVAQTKWRNIRDSFVKHIKSLESSEPAYKKYRNWQYVDHMEFLRKYLGGNKQKQGGKHSENMEVSLIDVVESVYGEPVTSNENIDAVDNLLGTNFKVPPVSPSWNCATSVGDLASEGNSNGVIPAVPEWDFPYATSVSNNVTGQSNNGSQSQLQQPPVREEDATDLLFLSFAKTMKCLSKKRQIRLKMKISELMGQAELEEESEKEKLSIMATNPPVAVWNNQVDSSENVTNHNGPTESKPSLRKRRVA